MKNLWSVTLGLAASVALMSGCQGLDGNGGQSSILPGDTQTPPGMDQPPDEGGMHPPGHEGEGMEPGGPPTHPGEPCEDLGLEIGRCYDTQVTLCEPLLADLDACHETNFSACDAAYDALLQCQINGQSDCESLALDAEQCSAGLGQVCEPLAIAVDNCFQSCFALEEQHQLMCGDDEPFCPEPETDTCGLMLMALGQCFADNHPEVCFAIEEAMLLACEHPGEYPDGHYPPEEGDPGFPPDEFPPDQLPPDEIPPEECPEDELPPDPEWDD